MRWGLLMVTSTLSLACSSSNFAGTANSQATKKATKESSNTNDNIPDPSPSADAGNSSSQNNIQTEGTVSTATDTGASTGTIISTSDSAFSVAGCGAVTVTPTMATPACPDDKLTTGIAGLVTKPGIGSMYVDTLNCCQMSYNNQVAHKTSCQDFPIQVGGYVQCPKNTFVGGINTDGNYKPVSIHCCAYKFDDSHLLGWGDSVGSGNSKGYGWPAYFGQMQSCPAANQVIAGLGDRYAPDLSLDEYFCFKPAVLSP